MVELLQQQFWIVKDVSILVLLIFGSTAFFRFDASVNLSLILRESSKLVIIIVAVK